MTVVVKKGSRRYFLGGAFFGGKHDQYDRFIRCGIWQSGWDTETDEYMPIIRQMRIGDRIAIKKGMGGGSSEMMIRAIGIIKDIDPLTSTAYVDWKLTGMKRRVDLRGCLRTVHGPYSKGQDQEQTDWINKVFSL